MVTKQTIKDIHALSQKKHRDARRLFVAEGPKVVADLLPLMECECLYATSDFLSKQPPVLLQMKYGLGVKVCPNQKLAYLQYSFYDMNGEEIVMTQQNDMK